MFSSAWCSTSQGCQKRDQGLLVPLDEVLAKAVSGVLAEAKHVGVIALDEFILHRRDIKLELIRPAGQDRPGLVEAALQLRKLRVGQDAPVFGVDLRVFD